MSDTELLNCYYGIHERIKDIDNSIDREDRFNSNQDRKIIYQQKYLAGGEAHGLMQKEKAVLEELKKRNIKP